MSQTNYDEQGKALDGMLGGLGLKEVMSLAAEGNIGFGRYVAKGTDGEKQCILPGAATDITNLTKKRGVALQSHANENPANGLEPRYLDKKTVSILTKGKVYVKVEEAVTVDDDVFVRFQGGDEGLFRTDADTADAAQLADARWLEGAAADGFALLELL